MTDSGFAAPRLRPVGDAALTAELGEGIDALVNARVRALDRALLDRPFPGFLESVPTHRSLLVCFDPECVSFGEAAAAVRERAPLAQVRDEPGRLHEIPVRYGGDDGPDLEEVARHAGLSPAEVVQLHSGTEYSAFMLGFLPGFAYLGLLPTVLDIPRLSTPRTRVPAGSVAVAGRLTGIYPAATPGGWRLIGRAETRLFDPACQPPSLVAPGDRVRFIPVDRLESAAGGTGQMSEADGRPARRAGASSGSWRSGDPAFEVLEPGLLTTVQGSRRLGYRRFGVAGAGALDSAALAAANFLLGNVSTAAGLECTVTGPVLRFLRPTRFAVVGADLGARLQREDLGAWPVPPETSVLARTGNVLQFDGRVAGCRAYLCFEGGIDVPLVLGSTSTDLLAGVGGVGGRALLAGDALGLVAVQGAKPVTVPPLPLADRALDEATVRVIPGPQDEHFSREALESLLGDSFLVTPSSDRVACRLEGALLRHLGSAEIVSDGMMPGSIQVPPDGRPIVMLADGPTTGGYPKIATVVSADLHRLAQLLPGLGRVRFERAF